MRCLDLFSGIGGFALACEWAGIETAAFCEIDPYCQAVLKKHFPEIPCHSDIRTLQGGEFEGIDLICGGFPCQPYSVAGNHKGANDPRDLWPEMLRVIASYKPSWICAENTPGFIGLGLDPAWADLEASGYEVGAVVLPALSSGAPHIRQRLFIVAHAHCERIHIEPWRGTRAGGEDTAQPTWNGADRAMEYPASNRRIERRPESSWGLAPSRRWWDVEPHVGRVAHGVPRRVDRLKCLGNAVVPQQVYPILKAIVDYETNRSGTG
jgi:DNA (cytosine-5)-methyltransferase 1